MNTFFLVLMIAAWCSYVIVSPRSRRAKTLLIAGAMLRFASSFFALYVIGALYGGGDYLGYMRNGTRLASWMDMGKWDLVSSYFWQSGLPVWGTQFISNIVAVAVYLFGLNLPELFVVFSFVGYAGCVLLAAAVRRVYGEQVYDRVLAGLMLFPSLWFWPSILGKEPLVLLGIGLALLGYVSLRSPLRPALVGGGILLVFLIRPQIAVVLVFALMAGLWLNNQGAWTAGRIVQMALGLIVAFVAISYASDALGFSVTDSGELDDYLTSRSSKSSYGGSAIELGGPTWAKPLLGLGTVLFRPFPWEASGGAGLVSAIETLLFWVFAWNRRGQILAFLKTRPRTALFWFSVAFVLVYATTLGVAVGNLGTLVRQRLHIYPFLFLFLVAIPVRRKARRAPGQAARRPALPPARPPALPPALAPVS